jgi:hypothetical protein
MRLKYLSLALLLIQGYFAAAQSSALNSEHTGNSGAPANISGTAFSNHSTLSNTRNVETVKNLFLTKASQGPGVIYFSLCSNYQLGVATANIKFKDIAPIKATGLEYHIELGLHAHYGLISDSRITSVSIQLAYDHFAVSDKYTDALNVSHSNNYVMSYFGLPITYSGIFGANGNLGFYFQLGINPQLQLKAKDGSNTISSSFKSFVALPYVSLGLAIPKETGRGALNKVHLIGPYASTTLGSITNDNSVTFTCLNIGIKYATLLTQ